MEKNRSRFQRIVFVRTFSNVFSFSISFPVCPGNAENSQRTNGRNTNTYIQITLEREWRKNVPEKFGSFFSAERSSSLCSSAIIKYILINQCMLKMLQKSKCLATTSQRKHGEDCVCVCRLALTARCDNWQFEMLPTVRRGKRNASTQQTSRAANDKITASAKKRQKTCSLIKN